MGTIASRPRNEEEAFTLARRIGWYLIGKKCQLVGPITWEHDVYNRQHFVVWGVRAYYRPVREYGIDRGGWWMRILTSETDPNSFVDIRQFNELEVL